MLFHIPRDSASTSASTNLRARKRSRDYNEIVWPKRRPGGQANIIYSPEIGSWARVERVKIGESTFLYQEHRGSTYSLCLSNNTFEVITHPVIITYPVELKVFNTTTYAKAKELTDAVSVLPQLQHGQCCKIKQREVQGDVGGTSDSDDESVPYPRVEPAFTSEEMVVLHFLFGNLQESYLTGREVGFTNCVGKDFAQSLCKYTNHSCLQKGERKYLLNTTSKGSTQPGAFYIKWSLPSRLLRSTDTNDDSLSTLERYSDVVAYNTTSLFNEIVFEVNDDAEEPKEAEMTSAEPQHNEQMLGLWRPDQQAMLGFEFYTNVAQPKILLLRNNSLHMFYLPQFNFENSTDLCHMTRLIIAFTTCLMLHNHFEKHVLPPSASDVIGVTRQIQIKVCSEKNSLSSRAFIY